MFASVIASQTFMWQCQKARAEFVFLYIMEAMFHRLQRTSPGRREWEATF